MSSVCYTYPDLDELVVSYLECGLYNTNYIYLNPEVMILLACLQGNSCLSTPFISNVELELYSNRAVVIESQEGHGTSTVLFVDYGTTEKVTNSSLKVLPPALRSQPRLAFKCTSQQESILKMPKEFFAEQVDSKELTVIIEGDSEPYSILIPELDGGCSLLNSQ